LPSTKSVTTGASSTTPGAPISEHATVVAVKDLVSADLAGERVMLHLGSGVYYGLDGVGMRIWDLIQEPCTIAEIRHTILDEFDVAPDRCQQEMLVFLADLAAHGLVHVTPNAPNR